MEKEIVLEKFREGLMRWYADNARELPWLNEPDPYKIWLSEVILQQTRVVQGWGYYERFIARFPNVFILAESDEDEVLKFWQGLGYYSRARNLLKGAKIIVKDYGGRFPEKYADILSLPGIGPYTAAAISTFAYNSGIPVLDGNVYRVLSRILDDHFPIDDSQAQKYFHELALTALDKTSPSRYNQAIMDFGAIQCIPKKPVCGKCFMQKTCLARRNDTAGVLPVKRKKVKVKNRRLNFIWLDNGRNETLLERRPAGDIWEGLYQPPLIEGEEDILMETLMLDKYGIELKDLREEYKVHHILTHQKLEVMFYSAGWEGGAEQKIDGLKLCNTENLKNFAFPKPISDFIGKNYISLIAKRKM